MKESIVESRSYIGKRFVVEIVVGITLFLLIAGSAAGLSIMAEYLASKDVSSLVLSGLNISTYSIFFLDLILLLSFLAKSTIRFWSEMASKGGKDESSDYE